MQQNTAPAAEITIGGNPLSASDAKKLTDVTVETRLDLPGGFDVMFSDSALALIDKDNGPLREGLRLEIALGYDKKLKTLITGEIGTVSAEMSDRGVFVRAVGYDMLHRLARGTSYRHYESGDNPPKAISDSSIAETLIKAVGLSANVQQTHSRNIPRTQDNRSDLDFLVMLARLNGYYLYSEGDSVFFTADPPNRGELNYSWGKDFMAFYPRLCLNGLVKTLENRGRDVAAAENYAETLDRGDLSFLSSAGRNMLSRGSGGRTSEDRSVLNLQDAMITDANDAKSFLAGAMRDSQALVAAGGSCVGDPELIAGAVLKVASAGRFSGNYSVIRAVHRFNGLGYSTDFQLRMNL